MTGGDQQLTDTPQQRLRRPVHPHPCTQPHQPQPVRRVGPAPRHLLPKRNRSSHMKPFTYRSTTHRTRPAHIGAPVGSAAMEALIDQPGPIELKTVGADWEAPLSGLLNIK